MNVHHAILCLFNETKLKRSFCEKNIAQFSHNLKKETWDIVYEESTQVGFTWFQCVIDLFFDKCFQKRLFKMTYQKRYPWMTDEMRTRITTKNKLGYKVFLNPENINLKNESKLKRNRLFSDLRNMEIDYYSNELKINKYDI